MIFFFFVQICSLNYHLQNFTVVLHVLYFQILLWVNYLFGIIGVKYLIYWPGYLYFSLLLAFSQNRTIIDISNSNHFKNSVHKRIHTMIFLRNKLCFERNGFDTREYDIFSDISEGYMKHRRVTFLVCNVLRAKIFGLSLLGNT